MNDVPSYQKGMPMELDNNTQPKTISRFLLGSKTEFKINQGKVSKGSKKNDERHMHIAKIRDSLRSL